MLGDLSEIVWKGLMNHNSVRLKFIFITQLQVQRKLLTVDKLQKMWYEDEFKMYSMQIKSWNKTTFVCKMCIC